MINSCKVFLMAMLLMLSFSVQAETKVNASPDNTVIQKSEGSVKIDLISQLQKDGYLSDKMAKEVANKYVSPKDFELVNKVEATPDVKKGVQWSEYMSWVNFIKTIAVICFIIMFHGMIVKVIKGLWVFIVKVPTIVYQVLFLGCSLYGTVLPETIFASQAFYIALLCSFTNIMIIFWVIDTYKQIQEFLDKLLKLKIAPEVMLSLVGMLYFGVLAFAYHSSIFGFFSVVCLSSAFSFSVGYIPGVLYLDFKENMLNAVVFGHLLVLGIYSVMLTHGMFVEYTQYFNVGIQYYCTIAMCVGLLVGSSPWSNKSVGMYLTVFVVLAVLASFGYFFWDLKVIASIILCFFVLVVIEWIGYMSYKANYLLCVGVIGTILYTLSLGLEKYGSMIVLSLN